VIVVDTSALLAIMKGEPEAADFEAAVAGEDALISAVSVVQATRVATSAMDRRALDAVDEFVGRLGLEVRNVDATQAIAARRGFLDYGKGRHPAGLNFGDCFSYGLARSLNAPLLFKGKDFALTDVLVAVQPTTEA
jgi:ribonuclease VapC